MDEKSTTMSRKDFHEDGQSSGAIMQQEFNYEIAKIDSKQQENIDSFA
jgi:hypothetical protein